MSAGSLACARCAGTLGSFGFDQEIAGFRRKDVVQAQMSATQLVGPRLGADQVTDLLFDHLADHTCLPAQRMCPKGTDRRIAFIGWHHGHQLSFVGYVEWIEAQKFTSSAHCIVDG